MMKNLFILLIAVAFFGVVESINCVYAINGKNIDGNHTCGPADTMCTSVTMRINTNGYDFLNKRQGCGSYMTWKNEKKVENSCSKIGNYDFAGQYHTLVNCCDTDLCNDDAQKAVVKAPKAFNNVPIIVVDAPKSVYNSATKNYSLIGFFIFLVSVPFFLA
uniref:UPAR/Ly6 domain-containing protein n=1 Tax=Panagrolaimus sp. PS1159 TaxID=55785 RepID=A0AC35GAM1_9BILA